jgi:hypothetical protein
MIPSSLKQHHNLNPIAKTMWDETYAEEYDWFASLPV